MTYVMDLPPDEFKGLLVEALESRREEQARQVWLAYLPWMGKDNFVPFNQFYQRQIMLTDRSQWRSADDIIADARAIRERAAKRKEA